MTQEVRNVKKRDAKKIKVEKESKPVHSTVKKDVDSNAKP